MALLLLLLVATAQTLSAVDGDINLDCTHDYEKMFCQFKEQNCQQYRLILQSDYDKKDVNCPLQQCNAEQCCCSLKQILIPGDIFTATVLWKSEIQLSEPIAVTNSFKPKTPTIVSVNESNRNYEVRWKTNMETSQVKTSLAKAEITYYKKGDTKKVSKQVTAARTETLNLYSYQISGQHLEPDTTYVVTVKTISNENNRSSDSSKEEEFKTRLSSDFLFWGLSIGLSVCSVTMSIAIYLCYVKLKNDHKHIKLELKVPPLVNKPYFVRDRTSYSSVIVEPICRCHEKQTFKPGKSIPDNPWCSGGNHSGSSKSSYGITLPSDLSSKLLKQSFENCNKGSFTGSSSAIAPEAGTMGSGSSGLLNQTYSKMVPQNPEQKTVNIAGVQRQFKMTFDSACSLDTSTIMNDPNEQAWPFPARHDGSSPVLCKTEEQTTDHKEMFNKTPLTNSRLLNSNFVDNLIRSKYPTDFPFTFPPGGFSDETIMVISDYHNV